MAHHGFGRGEYKYFAYPLPDIVTELRMALYPRLVAIANHWNEAMNIDVRFPSELGEFIERCHAAGRRGRRRSCCAMPPGTSMRCTKMCTVSMSFRCR